MQLYNTLSAEERAVMIDEAGKQRLTLSFYAYAHLSNPKELRDTLFLVWNPLEVLGRIYVAHEGINAQLSLPADRFHEFKNHLDSIPFLKDIRLNIAVEHDDKSFLKLTIKVRDKIVADGLEDETFDVTDKGTHLNAQSFNNLIEDPNTIVVDMRNHYESEIGHFRDAITPDVDTFRESLPIIENQLKEYKEDKNLLMYCTGGIRCEKASAYFKHKGFQNVYQLEGGIIEYTRQVKEQGLESKFIGKNFVFDHRLGERITDDIVSKCHQCGTPCDNHTNCANEGCHLLFIQCDTCKEAMENCCSVACVTVIHLPIEEQSTLRKGIKNGNKIFKKGKSEALKFKIETDSHIHSTATEKVMKIAKSLKVVQKKNYIGKGVHFFPKANVGQFIIEADEIKVGDKIAIIGPNTGNQEMIIEEMFVNDHISKTAVKGDNCTFKIPFRIRLSDKMYKIITS